MLWMLGFYASEKWVEAKILKTQIIDNLAGGVFNWLN
jgi:hypothetical protein